MTENTPALTQDGYARLLAASIPSEAVRDYCVSARSPFAPRELAALIANNELLSVRERNDCLGEIARQLRAEGDTALAEQIEAFTANEREMQAFLFGEESGVCYTAECDAEIGGTRWHSRSGLFSSLRGAVADMREGLGEDAPSVPYTVTATRIDRHGESVTGTFSAQGELLLLTSPSFGAGLYAGGFFADTFVDVPHPFRNGDLVRELSADGSQRIGIVNHLKDDAALSAQREEDLRLDGRKSRDWSDVAVPAEWWDAENDRFDYETFCTPRTFPAPLPADERDAELFKTASQVLRGSGSLGYLCHLVRERLLRRESAWY